MGVSRTKGFGLTFGRGNMKGFIAQRTLTLFQQLIKQCGLLASHKSPAENGILEDEVGKANRAPVVGRELVGDLNMWGDTGVIPTANTAFKVKHKFDNTTGAQLMGVAYGGTVRYYFGIISANWYLGWNNAYNSGVVADTNWHTFEVKEGKLYVDGNVVADSGTTGLNTVDEPIYLLASNNGPLASNFCSGSTASAVIEENGEIIASWDNFQSVQDTSDVSQALIPDATGNYQMQLTATHANYVQENLNIDSTADDYGYKVAHALGKNLFNKDNVTFNRAIDPSNGNVINSGGDYATDYILIDASIQYNIIGKGAKFSAQGLAFYDDSKVFLSGFGYNSPQTSGDSITFMSDSNAKYVRFTIKDTGDINVTQLEQGSTPTTYEAWQGYYKNEALTQPYSDGQIILPLFDPIQNKYTNQLRAWVAD